jgi:hypothetical protein
MTDGHGAAGLELEDFIQREVRRVLRFARALKPII